MAERQASSQQPAVSSQQASRVRGEQPLAAAAAVAAAAAAETAAAAAAAASSGEQRASGRRGGSRARRAACDAHLSTRDTTAGDRAAHPTPNLRLGFLLAFCVAPMPAERFLPMPDARGAACVLDVALVLAALRSPCLPSTA